MDPNPPNYFTNLLNTPSPQNSNAPNTPSFPPHLNFQQHPFFQMPQHPTQFPYYQHNQGSSQSASNVGNFPFPPNSQYSMFTHQGAYFTHAQPHPYMPTHLYQSQPMSSDPKVDSIGESEIPKFSTQEGLENINLDETVSNKSDAATKGKWSHKEDELLVSAWLTISTDSVTGNNQNNKDFWRRIAEYYNNYRNSFLERKQNVLKCHWYRMNPQVTDFNQCYIRLLAEHHSGWSDDQVKENARELYYSTHKKQFKYEHVWRIVKDEPKWRGGSSVDVSAKRTKTSESGAYTSSSDAQTNINVDVDEIETRPLGQKAAKRKGKEKTNVFDKVKFIQNELQSLNSTKNSKLESIREELKNINENLEVEKERKKVSMEMKKVAEKRKDMKILTRDTSGMTIEQLHIHNMMCDEIKARYGFNF